MVEAQKWPKIKQLLSIAQAQIVPRLKQLRLKHTSQQATVLFDEDYAERKTSSSFRKEKPFEN